VLAHGLHPPVHLPTHVRTNPPTFFRVFIYIDMSLPGRDVLHLRCHAPTTRRAATTATRATPQCAPPTSRVPRAHGPEGSCRGSVPSARATCLGLEQVLTCLVFRFSACFHKKSDVNKRARLCPTARSTRGRVTRRDFTTCVMEGEEARNRFTYTHSHHARISSCCFQSCSHWPCMLLCWSRAAQHSSSRAQSITLIARYTLAYRQVHSLTHPRAQCCQHNLRQVRRRLGPSRHSCDVHSRRFCTSCGGRTSAITLSTAPPTPRQTAAASRS
jgi:hypothetical protein